jgi:hypothetical protein
MFQLTQHGRYAPARSRVTVCEWADGRIAIEYRGRIQPWTQITGRPAPVLRPPIPVATIPGARATRAWLVRMAAEYRRSTNFKGTFLSS